MEPTIESLQAELAAVKDQLKTVNDEAKGHRLNSNNFRSQVEDLRKQLEAKDVERDTLQKKLTEDAEKQRLDLTARATAAETAAKDIRTKAQERVVASDLKQAAAQAGIADPDFLKLLDHGTLKFNDDGDVTNAAEAMAAWKTAKPHLFGQVSTSSTAPAPKPDNGKPANVNDMNADQIRGFERQMGITV
nr:hypothetical protein [uncultured Lichenicoccus sp.]